MSDIDAAHVYGRIRLLEAQVAFLANRVGVDLPDAAALASSAVPEEIKALARAGDKIGAIKRYRELTGCDLHEAKDVVDTIA